MLLLFVVIFVMANASVPMFPKKKVVKKGAEATVVNDSLPVDSSISDSLPNDSLVIDELAIDTTKMDSLQLAIYHHNKAIDDSIMRDSMYRQKKNGLEAPVEYTASDSIVYLAGSNTAYLYGSTNVKYENMDLKSEKVYMSLDSNLVHATGIADSLEVKGLSGTPVFQMGNDTYENDTIAFNFKTKKGLINNVYTQQEDGFLTSEVAKRNDNGEIFLQHGRYTTCDEEHPDFYIALSRAKVRPGKDVVFGPAYLVVADVPLPLAIPYGFFPFTKSYSSGFIMPTYGDESSRGFYLRDGGYYFAMSDKWDLKLLGEIYTKGSWGLSAASNYRKRYKFSGNLLLSYQDTKTGDKGMPDFSREESFKLIWSHQQDPKSNPFSTLSARVNFASQNYEQNNINSMYNPQARTQSTRTSSVSWNVRFSNLGLSLSSTANLYQNMRDSSISVLLPDLNISLSRIYPFKRKHLVGNERWYEKISIQYTGQIRNSINTKEDKLFHSNLIKDWQNGMSHSIPISGNFTVLNYLNLTPTFNFIDRMYTNKITRRWNPNTQREEMADTLYGFYNVYNWDISLSASTTLYGNFIPNRKLFGDKVERIRHVFTPKITFTYAPDFSADKYGFYDTYLKTDEDGSVSLVQYSPFQNSLFGLPGPGKSGRITFDVDNNIEMKIKSDKDSTGVKKISIIDGLGANLSYNMSDKLRPWSNLTMRIRLKWWKSYTFNLNAVFNTYAYDLDAKGRPYIGTHTEWSRGRFGRFQGMSQNFSFTLTPDKIKKWFGGGSDDDEKKKNNKDDDEGIDTDLESNIDDVMVKGQRGAGKKNSDKVETDDDGYMKFSMPWSLTFGYGINMHENTSGKFNTKTMRYPYKFSQTLNVTGNIRISDGWDIRFSSGYDFENKAICMTTATLQRDLHCFNMSCTVVLAPYTSYNFSFRCNASTLTDALKYDKRSGYSNAVQWY